MKCRLIFLFSMTIFFFVSCSSDEPEDPMTGGGDSSYSGFIQPLMSSSCATANCHAGNSPASNLNLSEYGTVKLIADDGRLIGVTFWQSGFDQMPRGQAQLSQSTLDRIQLWVDDGAPNN